MTTPPPKRPRGAQKGNQSARKYSERTVKRSLRLPLSTDALLVELAAAAEVSPSVLIAGMLEARRK